jgi:carbon storage regulator
MLVLTRKAGESIVIGNQVRITILEIQGRQIRLGVEAPGDISVHRGEVYERIVQENQMAIQGGDAELKALRQALGGKKPKG